MLCSPLNIELSDALTKQTGDGPYNSWPNHPETLHDCYFYLKNGLKDKKTLTAKPKAANPGAATLCQHQNYAAKIPQPKWLLITVLLCSGVSESLHL